MFCLYLLLRSHERLGGPEQLAREKRLLAERTAPGLLGVEPRDACQPQRRGMVPPQDTEQQRTERFVRLDAACSIGEQCPLPQVGVQVALSSALRVEEVVQRRAQRRTDVPCRAGDGARGQPSVVYAVDFNTLTGGTFSAANPLGYGALHGEDGMFRSMDSTITDNPTAAPGSGADRLLALGSGTQRFTVDVMATNVCQQPEPPPECMTGCHGDGDCATGFVCGASGMCVGMCDEPLKPPAVLNFRAEPDDDIKHSHQWATLHFTPPAFPRDVVAYHVRVSREPIVDQASFDAGIPARRATLAEEGLDICQGGCPAAGEEWTYELGHLVPQTTHYIGIQAVSCGVLGEIATTEVTTTAITFTTVSPCFVATAAYGTPLAAEVGTFRRFRDRHLMSNALGRALVSAYYEVGPHAAEALEEHPWLEGAARAVLTPLAALLDDGP